MVVVGSKVCLSVLFACSCFGSLLVQAQKPPRPPRSSNPTSTSIASSASTTSSSMSPSSSSEERAADTSESIIEQTSVAQPTEARTSPSSQPTQVIVTLPNGQWQFIPLPQYVRAPGGSLTGDPTVISPIIPDNSPYQSLVARDKNFFSGWRRIAIIAGICGSVLLILMFSSWAYYKTQKSNDQPGINKGPAPLPDNLAASVRPTTQAERDYKSSPMSPNTTNSNAAVLTPMAETDRPLPAQPQPMQYQSNGVMNAPASSGSSAAAYYQQQQPQHQPYVVYGYAAQPSYYAGSGYYDANYPASNAGVNYSSYNAGTNYAASNVGSNYSASNVGAAPPPQSGSYGY